MDLSEILASVAKELPALLAQSSPEELRAWDKLSRDATGNKRFIPNPGPQTMALRSPAEIIGYGGAAGSGKSYLSVGLAEEHAHTIIFRKDAGQVDGLVKASKELFGDQTKYNGTDLEHTWPDGKTLKFAGLPLPDSWAKHAGRERDCVAAGTMVLMADGSYRPIEALHVGDEVQTLEGPRRVLVRHPVQRKLCVEMRVLGVTQVQAATHPVMLAGGWLSAFEVERASLSTQGRGFRSTCALFVRSCEQAARHPSLKQPDQPHTGGFFQALIGVRRGLAVLADALRSSAGIYSEWFVDRIPAPLRPALSSFPSRRPQRRVPESVPSVWRRGLANGAQSEPASSSPQCWTGGCSFCSGPCGAQLHRYPSRLTGSTGAPQFLLPQRDAAGPSPIHSRDGAPAGIPIHSHSTRMYAHPYTGEMRRVAEGVSVTSACCEFSYVGEHDVYDIQVAGANHYITRGGIVNRNCMVFDEGAELIEQHPASLMAWNRGPKGQRCRIVFPMNPPRSSDGAWVRRWWAPWLDPQFPDPAESGEVRWALMVANNEGGIDMVWQSGPGQYTHKGETYTARSITFVRASLKDNPYRDTPEYRATLQSLPEPLRAQVLYGDFAAGTTDEEWQAIPSAWVREAQARWREAPPFNIPMCAIGVDAALGGKDKATIAPRHDGWYAPIKVIDGDKIKNGQQLAGEVMAIRTGNAQPVVDVGGGWGADCHGHLCANQINSYPYMGVKDSMARTREGHFQFKNIRSQAIWQFRESLDPHQPGGSRIALPPSNRLVADLTAPRYDTKTGKLVVESKEDVCKRLKRSTDEGDAVVMAWHSGAKMVDSYEQWRKPARQTSSIGGKPLSARIRRS